MTKKELIINILKKINLKNINKGMDTFNKAVQDFGNSMDTLTKEMSSDVEKSNRKAEIREKKNRENLEQLWGKKDEM